MTTSNSFSSVKLPAALVDEARHAAQPMRRSVASQIEYWATLGRALERTGITTGESHALIANEDRATYGSAARTAQGLSAELADLQAHVLGLAKSGALVSRASDVVEQNRAKASTGKVASSRPRKTA